MVERAPVEGRMPAFSPAFLVAGQHAYPPSYFCEMSRQAGEYSGYTYHHLPENSPELPKKDDATLASFAARIAFSRRVILDLLK